MNKQHWPLINPLKGLLKAVFIYTSGAVFKTRLLQSFLTI